MLLTASWVKHSWREIVRISNTQKMITTIVQKEDYQWIGKRTCSLPEPKLIAIYEALNYKQKHKFVVLNIPHRNIKEINNHDFRCCLLQVGLSYES